MKKFSQLHEIYNSFEEFQKIYPVISSSLEHFTVVDTLESQLKDWIKLNNPSLYKDTLAFNDYLKSAMQNSIYKDYGNWVFYPWKNTVARVLPEEEFIAVRTIRNKFKITAEEQAVLRNKKIGIVGLSVGQSVALTIAMERIAGELRIADFDRLELSNLNRIRSSILAIDELKTTIVAREIAEIDPYLKVKTFDEGVSYETIDTFIGTQDEKLDLIIDECDSIAMKIALREKAKTLKIPVIMDTSDRGMLDIERYDLTQDYPLFHGLVTQTEINEMKSKTIDAAKMAKFVKKVIGEKTMSNTLRKSMEEIGKTITTWPQLASGVALGGAIAAIAARKIALNKPIPSGRYFVDFNEIVK
jgi:molybdopterin/thiamine biosynthesis adenylyltransferase